MLIFVRLSVKYLDAIHHSDTFGLSISISNAEHRNPFHIPHLRTLEAAFIMNQAVILITKSNITVTKQCLYVCIFHENFTVILC